MNTTPSRDTVITRVTANGRAVTFLATDLIPGRPLRLWGALAETAGKAGEAGASGAFIRLGILGANDGWSVSQLLAVAEARFTTELSRAPNPDVQAILRCLNRAAEVYREALEGEPIFPAGFEMGSAPSSYPWTLARAGRFSIALCPDPMGQGPGISPEQLLTVLDLAMSAWLPVTPWRRRTWEARRAVREALTIEACRLTSARA